VEIDSRTSDALALAVRFNCPIFTYEFILETAGTIISDPVKAKEEGEVEEEDETVEAASALTTEEDLTKLTIKELNDRLRDLLNHEDYEGAAKVRDEIEKRKSN
jgi:bifunctional DNase/RNase